MSLKRWLGFVRREISLRSARDLHVLIKRLPRQAFKIHTAAVCAIKTKSSCEGRGRESQKRENERTRERERGNQKRNRKNQITASFASVTLTHARPVLLLVTYLLSIHIRFVRVLYKYTVGARRTTSDCRAAYWLAQRGRPLAAAGAISVREKIS